MGVVGLDNTRSSLTGEPNVSIICACRNEIRLIHRFLASLDKQLCADFRLEAILADGASHDGTRAILDEFANTRSWVRIIENPGLIASTGLNAAFRASSGSIILRMDSHTEYEPGCVAQCVSVLRETQAAMVGGPARMAHGSYWQNAIGLAYRSSFFSGGSLSYDVHFDGPVDSVPYGCWPRFVLESAGLFDEQMRRNQDDELSLRIKQAGGAIWQSSEIQSWYHPRRSPFALARQFFGYGFWKVYIMRKHRTVVHLRHIAPALAVACLALLLVTSAMSQLARLLLLICMVAYAAAVIMASLALIKRWSDVVFLPALYLVFPTAHLAYGAGTLCGFLRL